VFNSSRPAPAVGDPRTPLTCIAPTGPESSHRECALLGRIPGRCPVAGRRQYGLEVRRRVRCCYRAVMTKRAWAITGLAVGMFVLVGLTAAVVVWRIGFGVPSPSANDRIARAVTPTVEKPVRVQGRVLLTRRVDGPAIQVRR
jgi:hypothetical protein